jgi:hypothetical protein
VGRKGWPAGALSVPIAASVVNPPPIKIWPTLEQAILFGGEPPAVPVQGCASGLKRSAMSTASQRDGAHRTRALRHLCGGWRVHRRRGGHFLQEDQPPKTAQLLGSFFAAL